MMRADTDAQALRAKTLRFGVRGHGSGIGWISGGGWWWVAAVAVAPRGRDSSWPRIASELG